MRIDLMKNGGIILRMILLMSTSFAFAYTKILTTPGGSDKTQLESSKKSDLSLDNQNHSRIAGNNQKPNHALCFTTMLRRPDISSFSYSTFNDKKIQNIESESNHRITLDYSIEYHYRPVQTFSLGGAFERLQVGSFPIDLRYSPASDFVPVDLGTLPVIASDLKQDGDSNFSVANFYHPVSVGLRGYNYAGVIRAYIAPSMSIDPFIQISLGMTHNRVAVYRSDKSRSIHSDDQMWIWTVGSGISTALSKGLDLEAAVCVRNEHGFNFYDQIMNAQTQQNYNFTGTVQHYYSVDLKLALKKTW